MVESLQDRVCADVFVPANTTHEGAHEHGQAARPVKQRSPNEQVGCDIPTEAGPNVRSPVSVLSYAGPMLTTS